MHAPHHRQIDNQPAIAHGVTGDVVAAAADGDLQSVLAGGAHGGLDVCGAAAPCDQCWPTIDKSVVHPPRRVIAHVCRGDHLARHQRLQRTHHRRDVRHGSTPCDAAFLWVGSYSGAKRERHVGNSMRLPPQRRSVLRTISVAVRDGAPLQHKHDCRLDCVKSRTSNCAGTISWLSQ